jgi:ribosomal protein L9
MRPRPAVVWPGSPAPSCGRWARPISYGSVTASDIAEYLAKEGVVIDKRRILLDDPIKALGIYTVPVKLHAEVTGEIRVWVVKE